MKEFTIDNFHFFAQDTESKNVKLGLSRIEEALNKLNKPCRRIPAIQIIGTNGKGSITAFLESVLSLSNINIGVTTSPHIFDISERIKFNNEKITRQELEEIFNELKNTIQHSKLSPFELLICCGLKFFEKKKVDLLLLEAGLGGRLDATTAHKFRPIVAIGKIGIDHCEFLGESIEDITSEKIAVIQKDSFVISCKQSHIVEKIINKKIKEVKANIIWVDPLTQNWELGLQGFFQRENAAVTIGVINVLNKQGWNIKESSIKIGLAKTKWPGRLELQKWNNKNVLIDSAHNPSAAEVLARERENWINQEKGVYWIMGVQKKKDFLSMIQTLIKPVDRLLLVPVPNQISWKSCEIPDDIRLKINHIYEFEDLKYALQFLENLEVWPSCHPVIAGSIFLVSEFLKSIN